MSWMAVSDLVYNNNDNAEPLAVPLENDFSNILSYENCNFSSFFLIIPLLYPYYTIKKTFFDEKMMKEWC